MEDKLTALNFHPEAVSCSILFCSNSSSFSSADQYPLWVELVNRNCMEAYLGSVYLCTCVSDCLFLSVCMCVRLVISVCMCGCLFLSIVGWLPITFRQLCYTHNTDCRSVVLMCDSKNIQQLNTVSRSFVQPLQAWIWKNVMLNVVLCFIISQWWHPFNSCFLCIQIYLSHALLSSLKDLRKSIHASIWFARNSNQISLQSHSAIFSKKGHINNLKYNNAS